MGTINHKRGDYITLAANIGNIWDYEDDINFDIYMQDAKKMVEAVLIEYPDFEWFLVNIEPGYYEGFSVGMELNCYLEWPDRLDRSDALKEAALIRQLMVQLVKDTDICVHYPGWGSGWVYDLSTAIKEIDRAYYRILRDLYKIPMREESEVV